MTVDTANLDFHSYDANSGSAVNYDGRIQCVGGSVSGIRLNQTGVFNSPETRIEAMYSPDMYGEFPNPIIRVDK